MPRKSDTMPVKAKTIKWIIDTSGCTVEELSSKINVSPTVIKTWTSSNNNISITKLEKLAKYIKRPVLFFFLDHPLKESKIIDYRKSSNAQANKLTRKTVISIRRARYLQSIAKELLEIQNMDLEPKINSKFTVKTSPDKAAQIERKNLDLENNAIKDIGDFYKFLREKIESLNIFVTQNVLEINEIRGLLLSDAFPLVILINSKDNTAAKIFSLMHEYGHVLLRNGGMCMPQYENNSRVLNSESWCNRFAAEMLMPKDEFLKRYNTLKENNTPDQIIQKLSKTFKTSKLSTIIRIETLLKHEYSKYRSLQHDLIHESINTKNKGFGSDQAGLCVSRKGKRFIELVLNSKQNNFITNNDVIDYLDLAYKHMDTLYQKVG